MVESLQWRSETACGPGRTGEALGWELADLGEVLPGEAGRREGGGVGESDRRKAAWFGFTFFLKKKRLLLLVVFFFLHLY